MRKLFTIALLSLCALAFGQRHKENLNSNGQLTFYKKQLSEKEALKMFKESNIRKELNIKIKDFNYKEITNSAYSIGVKDIRKIALLNSTDDKELLQLIKNYYSRYTSWHTEASKNPDIYTNGCIDCYLIAYDDITEIKNNYKF